MFLDTITSHNGEWVAAIEKMFVQGDAEEHLAHCFDYLRQGLMCNADMSLEWPRTEEDGRRFAVDGWNVPHQCVDWVSTRSFMRVSCCVDELPGRGDGIHGPTPLQYVYKCGDRPCWRLKWKTLTFSDVHSSEGIEESKDVLIMADHRTCSILTILLDNYSSTYFCYQ